MMPTLLLFDIDATLLKTGGMGMEAMYAVAARLFGDTFKWDGVVPSGNLDPRIFAQAAALNNLEDSDTHHAAFRAGYLAMLKHSLETEPHRVEVLPGVHEILAMLRGRDDVELGLLTGNYTAAVGMKLAAIDVSPAWFSITSFGDEAPTRAGMVALALRKWEDACGEAVDPQKVIIIGDTPFDVACAQAHDCRSLAVATGRYSEGELREAGADVVVSDLSDARPLLGMIQGTGVA